MSEIESHGVAPDVIAAGLGLALAVCGAVVLAVALGAALLAVLAVACLAAGSALLAWAYLP